MTRQVILWRHGRTSWNVAGRVQGQSDIPLDETGHAQARAAAGRLAALHPQRILTSDLQRARDTAAYLGAATGVEVELEERFRELDFGAREGLTWREAWDQMPEGMQAWVDGDETQIPGSETHQEAGDRFAEGLRAALPSLPKDGVLVVVAHGAVLRTGICRFLGIPPAHWGTFGALNNCSWSVLEETPWRPDTQWRLTEWNAGSLPEPVLSDEE